MLTHYRHVWLFATLWTVACEAPLSVGFSRQESCSGLSCLPPGDLSDLWIKLLSLMSSVLAAAAKSLQSCLTLCDPMDCSPPGSPVPGILQARTMEWAAIAFSSAWKWKVKVKSLSRVRLLATPWTGSLPLAPTYMWTLKRKNQTCRNKVEK